MVTAILTGALRAQLAALDVRLVVEERATETRLTVKSQDLAAVKAAKKLLKGAALATGGGRHLKLDGRTVWSRGHYAEANSAGVQRKLYDVYYAGIAV